MIEFFGHVAALVGAHSPRVLLARMHSPVEKEVDFEPDELDTFLSPDVRRMVSTRRFVPTFAPKLVATVPSLANETKVLEYVPDYQDASAGITETIYTRRLEALSSVMEQSMRKLPDSALSADDFLMAYGSKQTGELKHSFGKG